MTELKSAKILETQARKCFAIVLSFSVNLYSVVIFLMQTKYLLHRQRQVALQP